MLIDFDKNSLFITFIFSGLLIGITIISIYFYYKISNSFYKYLMLVGCIPVLVILILGYLLSPQRIVFKNDKLKIDRIISDVYIDYSKIKEVNLVNSDDIFLNSKKIFASFGFWGYYGKFRSEKYGVYYLYARRGEGSYIILKTDSKTYVIAPSKPMVFMEKLKNKLK